MNERIKKMAEQASEYASKKDMTGEYVIAFDQDKYNEKFAELIVRECARKVEDMIDNGWYADTGELKKHFGVEE